MTVDLGKCAVKERVYAPICTHRPLLQRWKTGKVSAKFPNTYGVAMQTNVKARSSRKSVIYFAFSLTLLTLTACDRLGVPDPARDAAIKEADSRATGSACRHAGRGIEDCYALNPDAARAAVYAGWKEMNDYMRENNIQEVKPEIGAKSEEKVAVAESDQKPVETDAKDAGEVKKEKNSDKKISKNTEKKTEH